MNKTDRVFTDLLAWYDDNKRPLPWRDFKESKPDAYTVWLVEIMSQQTVIKTVIPYFTKFITAWPTVNDLARASIDEVLAAWSGLGYYRRAHALHKSANIITNDYQGEFPQTFSALMTLPGIGNYTAAAIASIAFGEPHLAIDGNLKRVLSRLNGIDVPPLQLDKKLKTIFEPHLKGTERPGDVNQALMDISAMFCRPRDPECSPCPLRCNCEALKANKVNLLPQKAIKRPQPNRYGTAFVIRSNQRFLMRKRPPGLLGGLWETPTTDWSLAKNLDNNQNYAEQFFNALNNNPINNTDHEKILESTNWHNLGTIQHVFTHFHLHLNVVSTWLETPSTLSNNLVWLSRDELKERGLSTLMNKVLSCAENHSLL